MLRSPGKTACRAHGARLITGWHNFCASIALAALMTCTPAFSMADDQQVTEYRIKAAFLYNFTRFVNWPADIAQPDRFTICILGADPFGEAIDSLAGKAINGKQMDILRLPGSHVPGECRVVYISNSESGHLDSILAPLGARPVLTVSDSPAFAEQGGIIRLKLVDMKVRFDINIDAARRAGLNISSKLLSLATIVRDETPVGAQ
ncbi:MAG: YfiR family protein [Thiohalobacterales bacterium]